MPIQRVLQLAKEWYVDPRNPNWRPRSREENQGVLERVGLTGDFWRL